MKKVGHICPFCGKRNVSTHVEDVTHPYGRHGDSFVVRTPVRTCNEDDCGFQYFDHVAEHLTDRAMREFERERGIRRPKA